MNVTAWRWNDVVLAVWLCCAPLATLAAQDPASVGGAGSALTERDPELASVEVGRVVRVAPGGRQLTMRFDRALPSLEVGHNVWIDRPDSASVELTVAAINRRLVELILTPPGEAKPGDRVVQRTVDLTPGQLGTAQVVYRDGGSVVLRVSPLLEPAEVDRVLVLVRPDGERTAFRVGHVDGRTVVGRINLRDQLVPSELPVEVWTVPLAAVVHDVVVIGELGKPLAKPEPVGGWVIADYSDNRILTLDKACQELDAIEEIFGVWDAEPLAGGGLLVTEFALNRVVELDSAGKRVWVFDDGLKNPYDADRLPNGNTLIADTFGHRVIEVDPGGQIVWTFDEVKPYDVERLANGNTLIADGRRDRVLEVAPDGAVVWEIGNLWSVHDADRLANGNTLIVQRTTHRVVELNPEGAEVWSIEGLSSPSDADRLADGTTVVAQSGRVEGFDLAGERLWTTQVAWAVEVNAR